MTWRSPLVAVISLLGIGGLAFQVLACSAMCDHDDHMMVGLAVGEAIDEPNGGNYARAVKIMQESDRPADEKSRMIGMLIINSYDNSSSRRPRETLQHGLALIERVAVQPSDAAAQQLRIIFERGVGRPPLGIPIDKVVADCWRKLELTDTGDRARCVALRRERLPQLSEQVAVEPRS